MSYLNNLLTGMESYLEGDVDTEASTSTDAEIAESRAEAAEVEADTIEAVKDAQETETATMLLDRMCTMYQHVKQFGIDRTFVSLYNRHGELDRVCGMSFPSCESMDAVGDRYSRYSQAFIAAMESDKGGFIDKVKAVLQKIWKWLKEVATSIWKKIQALFGKNESRVSKALNWVQKAGNAVIHGVSGAVATGASNVGQWIKNHKLLTTAIIGAAITCLSAFKIATKLVSLVKGGQKPADADVSKLNEETAKAEQQVNSIVNDEQKKGWMSNLFGKMGQAVETVVTTAKSIGSFISGSWSEIKQSIGKLGNIKEQLSKAVGGICSFVQGITGAVTNTAHNAVVSACSKLSGIGQKAMGFVMGILGKDQQIENDACNAVAKEAGSDGEWKQKVEATGKTHEWKQSDGGGGT